MLASQSMYSFIGILSFTRHSLNGRFPTSFFQANNEVVGLCPETTQDEMNAAAKSASDAFETWKDSSVLTRQAIMLKYQQKIKDNMVIFSRFFYVQN